MASSLLKRSGSSRSSGSSWKRSTPRVLFALLFYYYVLFGYCCFPLVFCLGPRLGSPCRRRHRPSSRAAADAGCYTAASRGSGSRRRSWLVTIITITITIRTSYKHNNSHSNNNDNDNDNNNNKSNNSNTSNNNSGDPGRRQVGAEHALEVAPGGGLELLGASKSLFLLVDCFLLLVCFLLLCLSSVTASVTCR